MSLGLGNPLVLAAAARRRRQRQAGGGDSLPAGNSQLISDLGGNSEVVAFYDVRAGITTATGVSQWDDCRGASGFGPSLVQATAANQPALNGTGDSDWEIAFDGSNDSLRPSAATNIIPDATGDFSLVFIGAQRGTLNVTKGVLALARHDGANRAGLSIDTQSDGKARTTLWSTAPVSVANSVGPGTTEFRLIVGTKNGTNGLTCDVPTTVRASGTGTAPPSVGDLLLTVGALSTAPASTFSQCDVRAVMVVGHQLSVAEVDTLETYATTYHLVVLV